MRIWLVTGASKGLGSAIARAALARGDRVALTGRKMSPADPVFAEFPDTALAVALDVSNSESIRAAVRKVEQWAGRIDILVNNAGQGIHGAIEETSDTSLRALFDVNFFGVATLIREVLPSMRERGSGFIINIGSVAGFVSNPGTGAYCATKFALEGLTEALRKEVAGMGIRVSMVAPGGMRTGFNGPSIWQADVRMEAYQATAGARTDELGRNAARRGSDVRAVAAAVWHLASKTDPPLHLILGADAIERIDEKLSLLRSQLAKANPLTEDFSDNSSDASSCGTVDPGVENEHT
ncbi:SDR family NAD(P)-dependent oxidoreductase [Mesorhizobium sp. CA13]|uniref:SDR family NAD(P)-dependent oxidoreductase n=1 Tax=Mesorhizobium sp. CA13 TaxID=2876643 RepID=UPI001CCB7B99|nr:SDR family NAD(P)-dependent oxidoreductase [Mesorhizobium sp. CA13]MBZ9853508.1 SDR family NAD(P)-dependent oxidoreductase [Mesorhizobium sp. CA13]